MNNTITSPVATSQLTDAAESAIMQLNARVDAEITKTSIRQIIERLRRTDTESSRELAQVIDRAYAQIVAAGSLAGQRDLRFQWARLAVWASQIQLGWI